MITMKKLTVLILFLIFTFLLASCSTQKESPPAATYAPAAEPAAPALSVQELTDGFFLPICELEMGTAGSSLKQAVGAVKVLAFVVNNTDKLSSAGLNEVFTSAWNALSPEQQSRFTENYPSLSGLLDDCLADFSKYNGLFDDAGVLSEMEALQQNPDASSSWKLLSEAFVNSEILKTDNP